MKQRGVAHFLGLASAAFDVDKVACRSACEAALEAAPQASSAHFALGVLNHAEGRTAEAKERFTVAKVLAQAGSAEAAEACYALGVLAEESGSKSDAALHFKAAVAADHVLAALHLAMLQMHNAQLQEAIYHFRLFLQYCGASEHRADAQQHLGRCLEQVGRIKEAAAVWKEAGPTTEQEAKVAAAANNWPAARDAFSKCLAGDNANNTMLLIGLAGALVHLGDFDEALSIYRRCAELEPNEKAHAVNAALMRQLLSRYGVVAADYESLLEEIDAKKHATRNPPARAGKKARVEQDEHGGAATEPDPTLSSAWCNLGYAAVKSGQLGRAKALFSRSLALDQSCPEAHYNAATLLLRAGRPVEAVAQFRRCVSLSFAPFELLNNMGVALIETQSFGEAHEVLSKALLLRPDDDCAQLNLARAKIGGGEAEAGLQLALDVHARSGRLRALQAVTTAQLVLGRAAEAAKTAQFCIDRDLKNAQSWALLGEALLLRGEESGKAQARDAFRKCVELDVSYGSAHGSLGRLLLAEGNVDDAVLHLRECATRSPSAAEAHFDLGTALALSGQVQLAVTAFRTCVSLDSSHHQAYASWARVLVANGQDAGALRCLELALRIVPDHVEYLLELASLYIGRGENKLARALLQRVLTIVPGHAGARARLIKLF